MGSSCWSGFGNATFHSFTTLCSTQAVSLQNLSENLTEELKDEDKEVVWMTLSVLSEMLLNRDVPLTSSLTLQLDEALRPLFDNVKLCADLFPLFFHPLRCFQETVPL